LWGIGHPLQLFIWVSLLSPCRAKGIHKSSSSGSVHCPLVKQRASTTVLHLGQFIVHLWSKWHPQQFFIWVSLLSPCGAKGIHKSSSSGSVHVCSFCFRQGDVAHLQLSVYGSSPGRCWYSSFALWVPAQSLSNEMYYRVAWGHKTILLYMYSIDIFCESYFVLFVYATLIRNVYQGNETWS